MSETEQTVDEIRGHLEDAVHLAHSLMRNGNMGDRIMIISITQLPA